MRALICGIGGQDGAYLTELLLKKGYEVIGSSRDAMTASFKNLKSLGLHSHIQTCSMAINDFRSVLQTIILTKPDEIYNLAGQSSVGLSFEQPVESMDSIAGGTLNILEAIRFIDRPIKFYNAGSSECFGNTPDKASNEESPFRPNSPYAVAKASAYWLVHNYRQAYQLFACTGILFNHESPLRPERFVTQKIIGAAARISQGSNESLKLGNIAIERDWGWAPEYVEAMWLMLQATTPEDYVIATGKTYALESFIQKVFSYFALNWQDHVSCDSSLIRPSDIKTGKADPSKALQKLNWQARLSLDEIIARMCEAYLKKLKNLKNAPQNIDNYA
jgi:GDPmannose 4,6-dehydratase